MLNYAFLVYKLVLTPRGGSRISGKGVRIYKGMGVRFADFISVFLNIPLKGNNFIFIGYLKTGSVEGGSKEPPLIPPLTTL